MYSTCPPVKSHEVQRAHQLIHCLRVADLPTDAPLEVLTDCLVKGGFHQEALRLGSPLTSIPLCTTILSPSYPPFLQQGLGPSAPPVLWVSSQHTPSGAIAIGGVGSRHPSPYRAQLCNLVGSWVDHRGYTAVSGGAAGCDTHFVSGAAGGWHFLPCGLGAHHLCPGATYASVWPYHAPFSGYQAMVRNSHIYASAAATFVFSARCGTGGSWGGAVAALRSRKPVIAIVGNDTADDEVQNAMRRLINLGAIPCHIHQGDPFTVLDSCLEVALAQSTLQTGLFARTA